MLTLQIFFSTTLYHVISKNEPSMKITIIAEIIFRPKHNLIFTTLNLKHHVNYWYIHKIYFFIIENIYSFKISR